VFAAFVTPALLYCQWAYGHPLPATYYAKQHHPTLLPNVRFFMLYFGHLFLDQPMLMLLAPVGWVYAVRKLPTVGPRILCAWALVYPVVSAHNQPNAGQHGRYAMFMIAPYLLLAAIFLSAFAANATGSERWQRMRRRLAVAWWVAALMLGLGLAVHWQLTSARHVAEINRMQVHLGRWIHDHTPPNALVAVNDVGAIRYFGERRIVDTCGLVTSEGDPPFRRQLRISRSLQEQLLAYLSRRRPDFAVLFPAWYPWMVAHSEVFEEVYAVRLRKAEIADQREMVVYRCHWPAETASP
jgi:hypothetical protein